METHTNKKVFAGLLAISCAFALGGCDKVETLPANYNDPILEYLLDGKPVDTDDNIMGEIYKKIAGDRNSKVLEIVLNELIESKFGTYAEIEVAHKNTSGELSEYIEEHKEFFEREGDDNARKEARFEEFYKDVTQRVSEAFYNLIVSGSYNNKNTGMFSEKKLYTSLRNDFWDLGDVGDVNSYEFKEFFVTNELTKDNATSADHLHIELYSNSNVDKRGYIEKKIFPEILKDKLVEQYIFDNNYDSLGRSYARNVNYVKVSYEQSSLTYTRALMQYFAKGIVEEASPAIEKIDFKALEQAVNGFDNLKTDGDYLIAMDETTGAYTSNTNPAYIFNAGYGTTYEDYGTKKPVVSLTINAENAQYFKTNDDTRIFDFDKTTPNSTYEFYGDTKLGALIDSYKKAIDADIAGVLFAKADDKIELDKFSSGKSLADSLKEKILDLVEKTNVTDGWYVKNGGISDLPAALRDRLFNINVSNDLDKAYADGGYFKEAEGTIGNYRFLEGDPSKAQLTRVPYIRNINGRKLVMSANATNYDVDPYNFVYKDDSAFYICQVLEAPNAPKLKEGNTSAYTAAEQETIARSIAKVLSTKDTYITNAYTKYLEDYKFSFNETSLYDYFKSQYPDLFDDED